MSRIFKHIYIEEKAYSYHFTDLILKKFPEAVLIEIKNYKEIFNRANQEFMLQKDYPSLILAKKENNFIYNGSPYCQNFGNENFYYSSTMMNCLYGCHYCYLQGMYPSAYIVAFVNVEDFYEAAFSMSESMPYIAISYDTDLLAFENILPYASGWLDFIFKNKSITIELRTKSANYSLISHIKSMDNAILAWTLSPDCIIKKYENKTPGLKARLDSVCNAIEDGWKVRLCFDPLLFIPDWKLTYVEFIEFVFSNIPADKLMDVSIGAFRMPMDYLKRIKKRNCHSDLISFPYLCKNGFAGYPSEIENELIEHMNYVLSRFLNKGRIFR